MPAGTSVRRTAILTIAGRTFLRQGYSDASMDGIAAEVGGSKSTLYRYFPSKAALFAAYVEEVGTLTWSALAAVQVEEKGTEAVLENTARAYLNLILSPSALAVTRLVMAETGRFPEIGRTFYERGIRRAESQIAAILQRLAERGDVPGCNFLALPGAAAHFRCRFLLKIIFEKSGRQRHCLLDTRVPLPLPNQSFNQRFLKIIFNCKLYLSINVNFGMDFYQLLLKLLQFRNSGPFATSHETCARMGVSSGRSGR
ncbi:TetR family transcriptional regulator [Azospirillum brasilense]|nr:TetR/AcrR family transcriptional regulator [Azospirillum baldaniorum]TWA68337.1 TetR family transcriptional regulator [Azospirillum brasilense]